MINRVVLMGRLVSDPELKTTQNGTNVTTFRIAVDRNYVKAGEERQADFFDIVAWRYTADFVCKHFRKGSLIAIDGQLQSRTYQAKDGTNRYVVEVIADNASFTGERRDNSGYQAGGYSQAPAPAFTEQAPSFTSGPSADFEEMPADDDLPF
ncbi:MAG: single-stranded DNA-binding protein [Eubacteriales bacterium]|nr:single-stranded DNA-binding protein [Eubacteriales bacterium]